MYLEPSQTSTMNPFNENSSLLKAVNYFHKKISILDDRLYSKYASDFYFNLLLHFNISNLLRYRLKQYLRTKRTKALWDVVLIIKSG